MAKENKTVYVILGLLNHRDLTGYDIKKSVELSLKYFWDISYGQIYPTLKAIQKKGYVDSILDEKNLGPDRIVYKITAAGREFLKKWLKISVIKEKHNYEILLKLFFGGAIDTEFSIKTISEFQERSNETLSVLKQFEKELSVIINDSRDHLFFYTTVLFGINIYTSYLKWAEVAIDLLSGKGETKHGD